MTFLFINIMGEKKNNDGAEVSTRKSEAHFQIILVLCSAKTKLSENEPEISLSWPQPHHRFY